MVRFETMISNRWESIPDAGKLFRQVVYSDFKQLRPWQTKALNSSFGNMGKERIRRRILQSPMGSGKSLLMLLLIYRFLYEDDCRKVILIVPQNDIGLGYDEAKVEIDGKQVKFFPDNIICGKNSTTERLRKFISSPQPKNPDYRIFVCTFNTFVAVFDKMTEEERKIAFRDFGLWIDEAHHAKQENRIYGNLEVAHSNKLGKIIKFWLDNNLDLGLTTATFCRGDGGGIIPKEYANTFERFELGWDEYIEHNCKHLKHFKYSFALCNNPIDAVRSLFEVAPCKNTIIFLPNVKSEWSHGHRFKNKDIAAILAGISPNAEPQQCFNEEFDCSYIELELNGRKLKIVDLVVGPKTEMIKRARYIKKCGTAEIDVILALGRFGEGSDYEPLERAIIIGKSKSIVSLIQRGGRTLRDYDGKPCAEIFHVLPDKLKEAYADQAAMRESFNGFLVSLLMVMIMEEEFFPRTVSVCKEPSKPWSKNTNFWKEYFDEEAITIKFDIMSELVKTIPPGETKEEKWKAVEEIAYQRLRQAGIVNSEHLDIMVMQLKRQFGRRSCIAQGIDPNSINMDVLENYDPLAAIEIHGSKLFGVDNFKFIRKKLFGEQKTVEETIIEIAEYYKREGSAPDINSKDVNVRRLAYFIKKNRFEPEDIHVD